MAEDPPGLSGREECRTEVSVLEWGWGHDRKGNQRAKKSVQQAAEHPQEAWPVWV